MKIRNAQFDGNKFQRKGNDDGGYIKGEITVTAVLSEENAEELGVSGCFSDRVDFKIPADRFLKFGGQNGCHTFTLKNPKQRIALRINTAEVKDAPVKFADGEHAVKITASYDSRSISDVSDFLKSVPAFFGSVELTENQGVLAFEAEQSHDNEPAEEEDEVVAEINEGTVANIGSTIAAMDEREAARPN